MINFIAAKYFLFYLLAFVQEQHGEYDYLSCSIMEPQYPTQLKQHQIYAPYTVIEGNIVSNRTHKMLQVRFPASIPFCPAFQLLAPKMECEDRSVVNLATFDEAFDPSLIYGGFGIKHTPGNLNMTLYSLLVSNNYDMEYLDNSFPGWFVNATEPVTFTAQCADCHDGPNIEDFFIEGSIATFLNYGMYFGGKFTEHVYKTFWKEFSTAMIGRASIAGIETGVAAEAASMAVGTGSLPTLIASETMAMSALSGAVPTGIQMASAASSVSSASFRSVLSSSSDAISRTSSRMIASHTSTIEAVGARAGTVLRGYLWPPHVIQTRAVHSALSDEVGSAVLRSAVAGTTYSLPALVRGVGQSASSVSARILAATTRALVRPHFARRKRQVRSGHKHELNRPTLEHKTVQVDIDVKMKVKQSTTKPRSKSESEVSQMKNLPTMSEIFDGFNSQSTSYAGLPPLTSRVPSEENVPGSSAQVVPTTTTSTTTSTDATSSSTTTSTTPVNIIVNEPGVTLVEHRYKKGLHHLRREKRGIWTGILKAGSQLKQVGSRIPSYAWPAGGTAIEWSVAARHLGPQKPYSRHTFFPTVNLARIERYVSVLLSIIASSCVEFSMVKNPIVAYDMTENVVLRGHRYNSNDVLFDLNKMVAGHHLHRCHPVFKSRFNGITRGRMRDALATMFDVSMEVNGIIYYAGVMPALQVYSDLISDLVHIAAPDIWHYGTLVSDDRQRLRRNVESSVTDGDDMELKVSFPQEKTEVRTVYNDETNVVRAREYVPMSWSLSPDMVYTVDALIAMPRVRSEFDIMTSAHYNSSYDFYRTVSLMISAPEIKAPTKSKILRLSLPFNLVDVLASIDPYTVAYPRMNLIRELISAFLPQQHLNKIKACSKDMGLPNTMGSLKSILALFWGAMYPDDPEGTKDLLNGDVSGEVFENVLLQLYAGRYMRIPTLLVFNEYDAYADMYGMFIVPVRTTKDISTWDYYSPVMLSTNTEFIPNAAFSICVSKKHATKVSGPSSKKKFHGLSGNGSPKTALFTNACLQARLHLTYSAHVSEIVRNQLFPYLLTTMMAASSNESYWMQQAGGIYDPILTDILSINSSEQYTNEILDLKDKPYYMDHPRVRRDTTHDNTSYVRKVCGYNNAHRVVNILDRATDEVLFSGTLKESLIPLTVEQQEGRCDITRKTAWAKWLLALTVGLLVSVTLVLVVLVQHRKCKKKKLSVAENGVQVPLRENTHA